MAKKAKKRGVKPGTKRGSYRKAKTKTFKIPELIPYSTLTLCGQLEDAVMNLETRISNSIAKINSLM